ncbi:MAG: DUF3179 domain-containing protein [Planctomycetaceae bacterium]|nr:DUF3179 domain-containing protein [Planctomycetaceae bacterium]MBT6154882.1 DUF3179 domain-containing protein [Planctomycetaceae bacterium]MBT6484803.1 DUF3179 domain-containing protein [Planctomycetaceae bacterium]MBT6497974.1 DUF3179 domain-containing protein [Planctomycetaceae bacterium]
MRVLARQSSLQLCLFVASALSLFFLATAPSAVAQSQSERDFQPKRLLAVQRAIKDAPSIKAKQVRGQVANGELVLGVVVKGEARAYPINMLTGPRREIINDTLGGQPIAATW